MRIFTIAILLMMSVSVSAQAIAIKTKTYYLGDLGNDFYEKLGPNGYKLLDSLVKLEPFDTVGTIKIKSVDETKYTSREYLSNHDYTYVTIFTYNGMISVRKFSNNSRPIGENSKIILKYSKDIDDTVNRMSLHIIN
jgi:hypothetical protein